MDDNQISQCVFTRPVSTENNDNPFILFPNSMNMVLEGEGKEWPETWKFRQRQLVFECNIPDGETEDTSVTIFKNFLNKKLVKYKITVIYKGNSNDVIVCCNKLIDHAVLALDAGEDLRLMLNEIKEEFVNEFINKQKAFNKLKREMFLKIDSARGPSSNLVPFAETYASSTPSHYELHPVSFLSDDSYVDRAQQRSYNENN